MKLSQLFVKTLRESPTATEFPSHIFLLRGGYIKQLSAGLYHLMPLGKRVFQKIENLIREEMNRMGGQEVDLPLIQPAQLWKESQRYDLIGEELARFQDRGNQDMVLAMTHEEAMTHLVKNSLASYRQLPVMLYQFKLKFRDEPRSRGGLIRVREFVMKDGYSFHPSEQSLDEYYDKMYQAYKNIFSQVEINPIIVESNSGIMGGRASHEYMLECPFGEDYLILSEDLKYQANQEIAVFNRESIKEAPLELQEVKTPTQRTIKEVIEFLKINSRQTMKCVFLQNQNALITILLRGDLDVSLAKVKNTLQLTHIETATESLIKKHGYIPGFAGPIGIQQTKENMLLVDISITEGSNFVTGKNKEGFHLRNANFERDFNSKKVGDFAIAQSGHLSTLSNSRLQLKKGIEIGNIFKLGTKFSTAANAEFLDEKGKAHPFIMGCYGIGLGRLIAAIVENSHDDFGPIWPKSVAPYFVSIVHLGDQKSVIKTAEKLYQDLINLGVEVLYDDRNERPGVKFKDNDLWGIPLRITISEKTLKDNQCEYKKRSEKKFERVKLNEVIAKIQEEAL